MLFIDARNYYTVVDRTLNKWSEWQLRNLNAIVWLYQGETEKYTRLLDEYNQTIKSNLQYLADVYVETFSNRDPVYQAVHHAVSEFTESVQQARTLPDYFEMRPLVERIYTEWKKAINVIVDDVAIFERINQYFVLKKKGYRNSKAFEKMLQSLKMEKRCVLVRELFCCAPILNW